MGELGPEATLPNPPTTEESSPVAVLRSPATRPPWLLKLCCWPTTEHTQVSHQVEVNWSLRILEDDDQLIEFSSEAFELADIPSD